MSQFTTHQVAQIVGVSLQTVVNYIDDGRIVGTRTAGGHRRVSRNALLTFLRRQRLPIPPDVLLADRNASRIVIVDELVEFGEVLTEFLMVKGNYEIDFCTSVFEAGILMGSWDPDLLIMDVDLPGARAVTDALAFRLGRTQLPIIRFTAHPRRQGKGVLLKPMSLGEIHQRLVELLNNS